MRVIQIKLLDSRIQNQRSILIFRLGPIPNRYQLETGVHYGGISIGSCGTYNTRAELEAACTAEPYCVGYSTYQSQNTEAVAENGFYPWCLKKTEAKTSTVDATHNYYKKIRISGILKFILSGDFDTYKTISLLILEIL